ncbi:hypothetical protein J4573_15580 [Actinomadura barringtoniae]|uniref:Uncharacterized protein n=1 Tax=Actinomadura barringtoniae TaxID=1427535 RepID=A0A939T3R6_9ACTN|nr:hypothetical protein [Actinomadura barringtoniae]MBO2448523.1 hypothetical protein [Actinomadura barringtoniae]
MTNAPPKHARGRHAKPPSEISVKWDRMMKVRPGERHRRRLIAVGTGAASVALLGVAALTAISATAGTDEAPRAKVAARNTTPKPKPSASASESADPDADPDEVTDAVPFMETKDPDKKVVSHVKDVRRSGEFLRVYTDLGEGDENSKPAKSLCEWATQFLEDSGDSAPRVFIHGKSSDNGSVVLANKQSDKDDCGVEDTP